MHAAQFFWFAAGVLVALAAMVILLPLAGGQPRATLWRAMPRWALPGGLVLLAAALGLYLWLGSPQLAASDATAVAAAGSPPEGHAAPAAGSSQGAGTMESAVTSLEKRLAQGGGADGDWELLAKSYEFLNRPADAALARSKKLPAGAGTGAAAAAAAPAPALSAEGQKLRAAAEAARGKRDFAAAKAAFQKLAARNEMDADAWADYADATGTLAGGKLAGEPEGMIRKALALDPNHAKALWLQASADEEAGRYGQAVASWQRLAGLVDPQGPDGKAVAQKLAEDQKLAGVTPGAGAVAPASGAVVQGEIVLGDAVRGKVPAGLTLFIVAKSVTSPGPPVAILKLTTGTWPVKFRLDDAQSMIPGRNLSSAGSVTVEARTSRTGQAAAAPGDFQGTLGPLDPKAGKPLRLVIDKVVG